MVGLCPVGSKIGIQPGITKEILQRELHIHVQYTYISTVCSLVDWHNLQNQWLVHYSYISLKLFFQCFMHDNQKHTFSGNCEKGAEKQRWMTNERLASQELFSLLTYTEDFNWAICDCKYTLDNFQTFLCGPCLLYIVCLRQQYE